MIKMQQHEQNHIYGSIKSG
ncbi:unnamed protein product, partial [Vitis vinifera]|uniref:Uncharacterized protein n=1 Tax=Vitis vinifera TaxID=29760 RepID=D7TLH8_VITVI